jgi:hypothetical protein
LVELPEGLAVFGFVNGFLFDLSHLVFKAIDALLRYFLDLLSVIDVEDWVLLLPIVLIRINLGHVDFIV